MRYRLLFIPIVLALAAGCNKTDEPPTPEPEQQEEKTYYYPNSFAASTLNEFYLWNDEIRESLAGWKATDEPISKVKSVRYKDPVTGDEVDKWTMLTDNAASMYEEVSGESSGSYGFDFLLMYYDSSKSRICAAITFVYAGGPAEKAGLKRGDVIMEVNGKQMLPGNYAEIVTGELFGSRSCKLSLYGGNMVTLEAVSMYEDPVLQCRVFEFDGKKVGYLHYASFTAKSCERLIEVCRGFKAEGIKELILDLRYNTGGLVETENLLMSMLAPEENVVAGDVFEQEIYNRTLTETLGTSVSRFTTAFNFVSGGRTYNLDTKGANIGIKKIYALVTGQTASASEALLCCLKPFMDVEIIGEQTSGKFCEGLLIDGDQWYNEVKSQFDAKHQDGAQYLKNWLIYVMIARYADRDGNTSSMPSGLKPIIECQDNPFDGFELGDPRETMLAKALERAGYKGIADTQQCIPATKSSYMIMEPVPEQPGKHPMFVKARP